jgi:hypothetical protein
MRIPRRWTKSKRRLELAKEYRRHELANKAFAEGFRKSGKPEGEKEFLGHAAKSRAQASGQLKKARESLPIEYRAAKRVGMELKLGRAKILRAMKPKPRKL